MPDPKQYDFMPPYAPPEVSQPIDKKGVVFVICGVITLGSLLIGLLYLFIPADKYFQNVLMIKTPPRSIAPRPIYQNNYPNNINRGIEPARQVGAANSPLGVPLADENGNLHSIKELQDNKAAFVYVFAGGCGHCMQKLQEMQSRLPNIIGKGYKVIGLSYMGNSNNSRLLILDRQLPEPILADPQGTTCQSLGIGEFTTLLIGADGNIYYHSPLTDPWPDENILNDVVRRANSSAIKPNLTTARQDFLKGLRHYDEKDYAMATVELKKSLTKESNPEAYYYLGQAQEQLQEYSEAINSYTHCSGRYTQVAQQNIQRLRANNSSALKTNK